MDRIARASADERRLVFEAQDHKTAPAPRMGKGGFTGLFNTVVADFAGEVA